MSKKNNVTVGNKFTYLSKEIQSTCDKFCSPSACSDANSKHLNKASDKGFDSVNVRVEFESLEDEVQIHRLFIRS